MSEPKHLFYESSEGVHLQMELNAEYSLCGIAFDNGSESDGEDLLRTDKTVVTCKNCIEVIKSCRGVKIKELR